MFPIQTTTETPCLMKYACMLHSRLKKEKEMFLVSFISSQS